MIGWGKLRFSILLLFIIVGVLGVVSANTIESSTMVFQGTLNFNSETGSYTGTIGATQAFDVYAKDGGTADVTNMDPTSWIIGLDNDAYSKSGPWGSWFDPDVSDWEKYTLVLEEGSWNLRYDNNENLNPFGGQINWNNNYAVEEGQNWEEQWSWGDENIPLEHTGFDVNVEDLGSDNYRVTLTPANGAITNIDKGEVYNTIQAAIDDAEIGNTIEVMSGTYEIDSSNSFNSNWLININKDNLIVKAAEGETPVILASMEEPFTSIKRIINIPNNNVTFEGFEIVGNGDLDFDGSYLGIRIDGSDVIVRDNVIKNTLTGIQANSIRANILKNKIYNVSVGISLMYKDSEYTVKDNEINVVKNSNISIDNEGFGLSSSNSIFENNTINVEGGVPEVKVHPEGSIQEGINAASDGDTVYVRAGLYEEDIIIDKDLILLGPKAEVKRNTGSATDWTTSTTKLWTNQDAINAEEAIIRSNSILHVIDIKEDNDVTIKGFIIEARNRNDSTNAHLVYVEAKDSTINNVIIENNIIGPITEENQDGTKGRMGIDFDSQNNNNNGLAGLLKGNKIFGAEGNGVNVFVIGSHYFPSMSDYSGMIIEENDIYGSNRAGMELVGGINGLTVRNNFVSHNGLIWDDGSSYIRSSVSEADLTNLKYGTGINLMRTTSLTREILEEQNYLENFIVENNVITNNDKFGIYTGPMQNNLTIKGNFLNYNEWDGIRIDESGEYHSLNVLNIYHEAYGYMNGVILENNTITGATSTYSAIRVIGKPQNLTINKNKINENTKGIIQYDGNSQSWNYFLNAQNNYWGESPVFNELVSGNVIYAPWFTDEGMNESTIGQDITSDENGTNATINEETNLSAENVIVNLPSGIIISGNSTWDGTINSPVITDTTSVNISASGLERSISKVVEVGFSGVKLTFDKAVKIVISGESGKKVGYSDEGKFVLIPLCNFEINETNLPDGGDCYYDDTTNNEIVLWTKHFTQFITFDENDSTSPTFNDAWSYPILPTILKPITVLANFTDASGIAYAVTRTYYQYLDGTSDTSFGDNNMTFDHAEGYGTTSIWNYTIPMTPSEIDSEGYFKIKFKAVDGSGNIRDFPGSSSYDVYVTVDLTAPNTTSSHNYTFVENTTQINLSAEDIDLDYSGNYQPSRVNYTSFRINKNSWINVSGNFTLSEFDFNEDGDYEIEFYSVDNAGNKEENKFAYVEIDTTAPALEIISPENKVYNNATQLVNLSSDGNVWYNWDGTNVSYSNPEEIVFTEGNRLLHVWANDSAGNVNYTSVTFIVDTTLPVLSITYPNNETYNVDVSELNYTFTEVNQDKCWYSTNLGITNSSAVSCDNFTNVESVEGLNSWTIYMNDTAGWVGSDTIYFTKDTINPLIQFESETTESGNYSQNYIEANVSVSDDGTGINETITYLYNETTILNSTLLVSNFTELEDGIYYLNATTYDNAGNPNSTETRTILLDTTAPELNIQNPGNITTMGFTFRANVSDNLSGVKEVIVEVINSSGEIVKIGNMTEEAENKYYRWFSINELPFGEYTIRVNSTDYAGNKESKEENFWLDYSIIKDKIEGIKTTITTQDGGEVIIQYTITARGSNYLRFAMDDIGESLSPAVLNATISRNEESANVRNSLSDSESLIIGEIGEDPITTSFNLTLQFTPEYAKSIGEGTHTINYQIQLWSD